MKAISLEQLLELTINLSGSQEGDVLLERILNAAMDITECDGGTLYINTGKELAFKLMITKSKNTVLGGRYGGIMLPPVPIVRSNVCACAVLYGKLISLPDVDENTCYDFSGPRRYDAMTGYKTTSMLVVPMENDRGQIIGVLQLINAFDQNKEVIPFPHECEHIILALSSLAAICLTNMNYALEMRTLMGSLVGGISAAIDARTPYNADHTRNMAHYAANFLNWLDRNDCGWKFSPAGKREFLMAVWLHDIGKITTPLEIMDKTTRLGAGLSAVMDRLARIALLARLRFYEQGDPCENLLKKLTKVRNQINKINEANSLTEDMLKIIGQIEKLTYIEENGEKKLWLTKEEVDALAIRKGNLTQSERKIMENHVAMTARILAGVRFSGEYSRSAEWAGDHHEFLDGSGYPRHLSGNDISRETRLLTILDIFDALTASDRPYRQALPNEAALATLQDMGKEGKLDAEILAMFIKSRAWE